MIGVKSENGITLATLAVTVMVLAILASTVVFISTSTIEYTRENKFIAELKIIKEIANIISKEIAIGSMAYNSAGSNIDSVSSEIKPLIVVAFAEEGVNGEEQVNYKYFSDLDLKKLGIYDIQQNVLINFSTLDVISVNGIKIGNNTYHTIESVEAVM